MQRTWILFIYMRFFVPFYDAHCQISCRLACCRQYCQLREDERERALACHRQVLGDNRPHRGESSKMGPAGELNHYGPDFKRQDRKKKTIGRQASQNAELAMLHRATLPSQGSYCGCSATCLITVRPLCDLFSFCFFRCGNHLAVSSRREQDSPDTVARAEWGPCLWNMSD